MAATSDSSTRTRAVARSDHIVGIGIRLWGFLVLVLLPLSFVGCGEGAQEEAQTEEVAEVEEPQEEPDTTVTVSHAVAERPYSSRFAHAEHRELDCATCHQTVPNHTTHSTVSCVDCHSVPVQFETAALPERSQCLECHHVDRFEYSCTDCHTRREIGGPRQVDANVVISTREQPQHRSLPFDHRLHGNLTCLDCHSRSIYSELQKTCASCHDNHHRPEANCMSCHEAGEPSAHPQETHEGCAGSGCHQDSAVISLPPSRSLCLVCHQDKTEHETAGDCAECHGIRVWNRSARGDTQGRTR